MIGTPRMPLFGFILCLGLFLPLTGGPLAHGGADHVHEEADSPLVDTPARTEAASAVFEVVAVAEPAGEILKIYLDRFTDNTPITEAILEVDAGEEPVRARHQGDGVYHLAAPWVSQPGNHDLTFSIEALGSVDLLLATLSIPEPAAAPPAAPHTLDHHVDDPVTWGAGIGLLLLGMVLGAALVPRRRTPEPQAPDGGEPEQPSLNQGPSSGEPARSGSHSGPRAVAGLLLLVVFGWASAVEAGPAGPGHSHGLAVATDPAPGARRNGEAPSRLADGTLFVPKSAQRLFGVRTLVTRHEDAFATKRIAGEVIADPTRAGRVQATQAGRIETGEGGLPILGQPVDKGDILAYVTPAISSIERGTVAQELAGLDERIALARKNVNRLDKLKGSVPQREIDRAASELAGLKRQRAALKPALKNREVIRASVSGVISAANVVAGQVVEPNEVLFEIIDPARLWIEGVAFDPAIAADVRSAAAVTTEGASYPLSYVGRAPELRQHAIPMIFKIDRPSASLSVGTPVQVLVQSSKPLSGIVVPTESVVRAPNGQAIVWQHVSAERFRLKPVQAEPLDGRGMLITAGLDENTRVVTKGAHLLSEVR